MSYIRPEVRGLGLDRYDKRVMAIKLGKQYIINYKSRKTSTLPGEKCRALFECAQATEKGLYLFTSIFAERQCIMWWELIGMFNNGDIKEVK